MNTRPERLVLVTGTGTGVGKTWVSAALARRLREDGHTVSARKPVQSFEPEAAGPNDAEVLGAATGQAPERVCPPARWYERALAPPIAAEVLGRPPFTIADLIAELDWDAGTGVGLVEGAGGPRSPLAGDGDTVDLAAALAPDGLLLVADAGLGAINATRLAVAALAPLAAPLVVQLNRYRADDECHRHNLRYLRADGLEVVTSVAELATRRGGGRR